MKKAVLFQGRSPASLSGYPAISSPPLSSSVCGGRRINPLVPYGANWIFSTLITCAPPFDPVTATYANRLVVRAVRAERYGTSRPD